MKSKTHISAPHQKHRHQIGQRRRIKSAVKRMLALTQSTPFRQSQWYPSAMPRWKDFPQSSDSLEAPAIDDVSK
jgi:hypothetical protein